MSVNNVSHLSKTTEAQLEDMSQFPMYIVTQWLRKICPVFIIAFGSFGNVMTLIILRRLGFSTTNVFIRSLAVSDLFLLHFGLFNYWLRICFNISFKEAHVVTCKLSRFITYWTGVFSAWLITVMTVQRAMSVVWPHRIAVFCTEKITLLLIAGIVSFSAACYSHLLYGFTLISTLNETEVQCTIISHDYYWFLVVVWSWIDLLAYSLIPIVVIVISNTLIIWNLKVSYKNALSTLSSGDGHEVRSKKASSLTKTLLAVSITFIFLTLPFTIYIIIGPYVFQDIEVYDIEIRLLADLVHIVVSLLWYSNSAVNFYIYCLTGSKFRSEIKKLIYGCRTPVGADRQIFD